MLSRERRTYEQWSGRIIGTGGEGKLGNAIESVSLIFSIYAVSRKSPTYVCKFQILEEEAQGFSTFHRPRSHK